jgi:DNA polymerase V
MLLELVPAATVQGDLWTAPDSAKAKALMRTVDRLNGNYGRGTVRFASTGFKQGWKLRSEQRSPHYTTDWDDLLVVRQ